MDQLDNWLTVMEWQSVRFRWSGRAETNRSPHTPPSRASDSDCTNKALPDSRPYAKPSEVWSFDRLNILLPIMKLSSSEAFRANKIILLSTGIRFFDYFLASALSSLICCIMFFAGSTIFRKCQFILFILLFIFYHFPIETNLSTSSSAIISLLSVTW